jgi:hypothetical protein
VAEFRIVFDEDGYPRELRTAAERERAIARGALTRDTDLVVYRDGEPAYACKAGSIPEIWNDPEPEALGSAPPDLPLPDPPVSSAPAGPAQPPVAPTLIPPPPQRLAAPQKPSPWSWLFKPGPVPPAARPRSAPRPSPPPPPARKEGGCMATIFWLFVIFVLLKAFA